MDHTAGTFPSPADGLAVATYTWEPAGPPRAVVQLAHGVAEFGPAGWPAVVGDAVELGHRIAEQARGLPIVLLGHSMGSFVAQQVLLEHSADYAAAVLTGSSSVDLLAAGLAESGAGDLIALNQGFEPRTGYEWLSRDDAEVDEYVRNPRSGFDLADDVLPQMLSTAARLADPEALRGIRPDLPILLASGAADPLAGGGALVETLGARYRDAGLTDVTVRLYPEARHEVFNETNRDEVTADVLAWLADRMR